MSNPFFKNQGQLKISKIVETLNLKINSYKDKKIYDIKDLVSSTNNDITFLHSKKYNNAAKKTKASVCITTEVLKTALPEKCLALVVENVLVSTSKITSMFYPDSITDDFDAHEVNSYSVLACDGIMTSCPISKIKYKVIIRHNLKELTICANQK